MRFQPSFAQAPVSEWRAPKISDLPSWSGAKRVSVDTETNDKHLKELGPGVRRGAYVVGYSFAIEDGPSYYVPIRHDGGDNVEDPDQALRYLADQAKTYKETVVGMHLAYDYDFLGELGIDFNAAKISRDVMINEALIDELADSYTLDDILKRYGMPGKDESLLQDAARYFGVDPKAGLWMLPARYVGAYAQADTTRPLALLRRQERKIDEQEIGGIVDLESKVLPVLVRMRRRGVRVNMEKLAKIEEWSLREEAAALDQLHKLTGVRIGLNDAMKSEQVEKALLAIGYIPPRTEMGKPQLDKVTLGLAGEAGACVIRARKVNKLRTTFAASIRAYETNGRIHCSCNQLVREREGGGDISGARFGRMSMNSPNLQQQPSRDEFAAMWRDIYEPEEGSLWGSADYSQQEPRMQTHYAVLAGVDGAEEAMAAYINDPNLDHHQMMADLTGLPRKYAKNIYLGLCYGMGSGKLARELGLPVKIIFSKRMNRNIEIAGDEAQAILDQFNERAPHVRALASMAEARAKEVGFLTTIGGRRCRFPRKGSRFDWTYKAMNRLIQGSSADQTKMAMVALDEAGLFMQLQIHDSIEASVQNEDEIRRVAEIMRDVLTLKVPCKVDYKIGPTWGSLGEGRPV